MESGTATTTIVTVDSLVTSVQGIFTNAATQLGGMLVPIMTAGVVISLGIAAFVVAKRIFGRSTR